jgi:hypothetical protein
MVGDPNIRTGAAELSLAGQFCDDRLCMIRPASRTPERGRHLDVQPMFLGLNQVEPVSEEHTVRQPTVTACNVMITLTTPHRRLVLPLSRSNAWNHLSPSRTVPAFLVVACP